MKAEEEELVMVVVIIDICTNLSSPPIPHDSKSPEDRTSFITSTPAIEQKHRRTRGSSERTKEEGEEKEGEGNDTYSTLDVKSNTHSTFFLYFFLTEF